MNNLREKVTFILSGLLYLLFNLRLGATPVDSFKATGMQLLQTVPFIAGITWLVVAFIQYMANGQKMPWDRRVRLFFAIGIMAGLFYGIYEYAGAGNV